MKQLVLCIIFLIVLAHSFQIKIGNDISASVDITTTNITVPKGFTGLNISASIIGTFTLNNTSQYVYLSLYFDVPSSCFQSKSYYAVTNSFSVMNTVTCTIWSPITTNQSITVSGYGWISKSGNSMVEASSRDEQKINITVK